MARRKARVIGTALASMLEGLGRYGVQQSQQHAIDERQARGAEATTQRELLMKVMEEIRKGETDPEAGTETLKRMGIPVPAGAFESMGPSVSTRLSGVLGGMNKASSVDQVPSPTSMATEMKAKRVPLLNPGTIDPASGKSSAALSPELSTALGERESKLGSFPAQKVSEYDPELMAKVDRMIPAREMGQARTFQQEPTPTQAATRTASEQGTLAKLRASMGIPEQEGTNVGTSGLAAALANELSATRTAAEIDTANQKETGTRAERTKTAAGMTAATTQAGIDVTTQPANVGKMGFRDATVAKLVEQMKDDLKAQGIAPQLADSFIHTGSETKAPYMFFSDPRIPADMVRDIANKVAVAHPGIRFLNKDQADALQQISVAGDAIDGMLNTFQQFASKGPDGRIIAGPANMLSQLLQTHPELAAADAYFGPNIEIFRALTAGVRGFRMTQWEIQQAKRGQINPTDSWPTMLQKAAIMHDVFESIERRLIANDVGGVNGVGRR